SITSVPAGSSWAMAGARPMARQAAQEPIWMVRINRALIFFTSFSWACRVGLQGWIGLGSVSQSVEPAADPGRRAHHTLTSAPMATIIVLQDGQLLGPARLGVTLRDHGFKL